jgi:hypothetical protein
LGEHTGWRLIHRSHLRTAAKHYYDQNYGGSAMIKKLIYRWKYRKYKTKRRSMCENCAFRHGSAERSNCFKWQPLIAALRLGDTFHCHETMWPLGFGIMKKYGKFDNTRRVDGMQCQPHEHPLCAGYVAMFPERHENAQAVGLFQHQQDAIDALVKPQEEQLERFGRNMDRLHRKGQPPKITFIQEVGEVDELIFKALKTKGELHDNKD